MSVTDPSPAVVQLESLPNPVKKPYNQADQIKGQKTILQVNTVKKAQLAVSISDNFNFRVKKCIRDSEGHFLMFNIYIPQKPHTPKYIYTQGWISKIPKTNANRIEGRYESIIVGCKMAPSN